MFRDQSKVVDATAETRVNWEAEVSSGNLVPVSGLVKDTSDPRCLHIQGRAVSEADQQARIVPASVMKEVSETGRYPKSSGKLSFQGGWPTFAPDGSIIRQEGST